jgi:hypothetical protein
MKSVLKVSHWIEIPCDRRYYWLPCIVWTFSKSSYLILNYRPNLFFSLLFYRLVTAYFALRNTFCFIIHSVKYSLQPICEVYCAFPTHPTLFHSSIGNRGVSMQITRTVQFKYRFLAIKYVCYFTVRITQYYFLTHDFKHFTKNGSFMRSIYSVDCAASMPYQSSPAYQYDSSSHRVQLSKIQRTVWICPLK